MLSQIPEIPPAPRNFPKFPRARAGRPRAGGGPPGGEKKCIFFPPLRGGSRGVPGPREAVGRQPPLRDPPENPKKRFLLSRLGELLNTQKNVHFLPPPGARGARADTPGARWAPVYVGGLRPPTTLMPENTEHRM